MLNSEFFGVQYIFIITQFILAYTPNQKQETVTVQIIRVESLNYLQSTYYRLIPLSNIDCVTVLLPRLY